MQIVHWYIFVRADLITILIRVSKNVDIQFSELEWMASGTFMTINWKAKQCKRKQKKGHKQAKSNFKQFYLILEIYLSVDEIYFKIWWLTFCREIQIYWYIFLENTDLIPYYH